MHRTLLPLALAASLAGCTTASPPAAPGGAALTPGQKESIGRRIWANECGGTIDGLTSWNEGENFASLGIGHTLWFPAGVDERFEETFPKLVRFIRARGVAVPAWAVPPADCPWPDRAAFLRDFRSPRMNELRRWLAATIGAQTDYLIARQQAALPKMLEACPAADRARVHGRFQDLAATPAGLFALIDYVNFKGEGTKASERYHGQGWGLLQVLQEMRGEARGPQAVTEFAHAADRVLTRRVRNSPPARGEARWLPGWRNRLARYAQG